MHTEYLTDSEHTENDDLHIKGAWFVEGGITPEGKSWVAPSPNFLKRWRDNDNHLSDRLAELGFSHSTGGKAIGASQDEIFYFSPNTNGDT